MTALIWVTEIISSSASKDITASSAAAQQGKGTGEAQSEQRMAGGVGR